MTAEKPSSLIDTLRLELDRCIRCGFCYDLVWLGQQNMCPMIDIFGFQSYGAKGKVILGKHLLENQLEWTQDSVNRLYACLDCKSCDVNCAMAMPLSTIFHELRKIAVIKGFSSNVHRQTEKNIIETGNVFGLETEDRPNLSGEVFAAKEKTGRVYFRGCLGTFLRRDMINASMKLLDRLRIPFNLLEQERCCGFPLWQQGKEEEIRSVIEETITEIRGLGASEVVFSCPSCYNMFKEKIPKIVGNPLPFKCRHILELLEEKIKSGDLDFSGFSGNQIVTYHDPCELARSLNVIDQPRNIIHALPDINFKEMVRSGTYAYCCGGPGKLLLPWRSDVNIEIAQLRVKEAIETQADVLLTACPSCKSNLKIGAQTLNSDIQVKDLIEFILEGL